VDPKSLGLSCTNPSPRPLFLSKWLAGAETGVVLPDVALLVEVFAHVPNVAFCLKDRDGRYTAANPAFVRRCGRRSEREVVGRRAIDLFDPISAGSYERQDRTVFLTGVPLRHQLEIISDPEGREEWFVTSKQLTGRPEDANVLLAVVSAPARLARRDTERAEGLRSAIDLARDNFADQLSIEDLAAHAGMTVSGFERALQRALGVAPKPFLSALRVDAAARLLATTTRPLSEVASACGFYDQSHFTRAFRSATGLTPGVYRTAFGTADSVE
jgi:AraC-like DNA-binding protein